MYTDYECIQPLSRCLLKFPASSFFSESVLLLLLLLFSLSSLPPYVFLFSSFGLLANSYLLLACLIRAAISRFSFRLHLSSVDLISDLLCQSVAIVFLDGGRVSEGLVMVSLAFHLFVVGTVIVASVLLYQVKRFFIPSTENVGATHKEQRQCMICKRLTKLRNNTVVSHTSQYTINTSDSHDTSSLT